MMKLSAKAIKLLQEIQAVVSRNVAVLGIEKTENISAKLTSLREQTCDNEYHIIHVWICDILEKLAGEKTPDQEGFLEFQEQWLDLILRRMVYWCGIPEEELCIAIEPDMEVYRPEPRFGQMTF